MNGWLELLRKTKTFWMSDKKLKINYKKRIPDFKIWFSKFIRQNDFWFKWQEIRKK
jgi:hypothetical protein